MNTQVLLGDVLTEVKTGIGKDWDKYPVLGATRDGLAPAKERPGKHAELYKPVNPGTIFYNPMRILIGSIAFVDEDDRPGITSPDYVVLQGKKEMVDTRYFYYWMRSPAGEKCISSLARGAVRERMLFNRLIEANVELPDFETQLRISKALVELRRLKKSLNNQLKEIEKLPHRIVASSLDYF
jgi:type I restriction enzyme S subunit